MVMKASLGWWCVGLSLMPLQVCCQQLEQETISIHGNRGLPKTVYIAPWKRLGQPLEGGRWESRMEDPLAPLEQDLFLRQLELHRQDRETDVR